MTTCTITLDDMICFDVYAANLAIGRLYKPLLTQFGVTYPQYLVLMSLWEKDGQTVGEIGALLGLESSTLTPLIKRLATAGLVTRLRAVEDERRVHISLTDKGRDMANSRDQMAECLVGAAGLTLQEFGQLRELLRKLRSNLA
ncbi:DNA-binding MarR family transcriptional regulator [Yoonia maritima]|uniref:DNA-binding MarR family transcriptional regulator n=1 Tax=Yoonia maritima TaxID=1435347 RepID=A0A2T0W4H7_9RHOB|nr:MarR family transcriptional regulator [Yoonia maritima]PRY80369.1 DNA-binding MarR family transcriptional regulator [Yoonia maritima]